AWCADETAVVTLTAELAVQRRSVLGQCRRREQQQPDCVRTSEQGRPPASLAVLYRFVPERRRLYAAAVVRGHHLAPAWAPASPGDRRRSRRSPVPNRAHDLLAAAELSI